MSGLTFEVSTLGVNTLKMNVVNIYTTNYRVDTNGCRFLKAFTIHLHGGPLGHVACTIYIYFLSHLPRRLHTKFGFDWPSGFREENV